MSESNHSVVQTITGDKNIFTGTGDIIIHNTTPLPPVEAKDRANLLILLNKVKVFWIEGFLEKSLYDAVLLELGKETRLQAVDHPWEMMLELPDQTNRALIPGTKTIDVFDKMNRGMLILGEPGSGKTTTLLELTRDLIARAETDSTQPIPVIFNLSSWIDKQQSLNDWLVLELSAKYQIPKRIGNTWLKDNRILPLLDGLDEVKSEIRAACVEAINQFSELFALQGCVVCCRQKDYTALPVRLKLNGAICLQPITFTQVNNYLEAYGNKLAALRFIIQKDEALREMAQSPLVLSVMCLAYQDVPVETLTTLEYHRDEDRRKALFDTYIKRMLKRKGKANQHYAPKQIITWLIWLAQKMRRHNQNMLLIEQLQPSWLSSKIWLWVYTFTSRYLCAFVLGLLILLPMPSSFGKGDGAFHISMIDKFTASAIWIGLFVGLGSGFIDALRFFNVGKTSILRQPISTVLFLSLIFYLFFFYSMGLLLGIVSGLGAGVSFGLIFGLRSRKQSITQDIQGVESLGFVWSGILKGSLYGLIFGFFTIPFTLFVSMCNS